MNQIDVFYRAFLDYKKGTQDDLACAQQRKAIVSADRESERITVVKTVCTVEEDWVLAIETGLVHIEKAINEARQFIRTTGEVVPIEKVKRVSKNSVEHLARHSDFITKQPEGKDVIPDKLYIVERLSDFAVYENRFLYMLLCYLKSFISLRYTKISELTNTYYGGLDMHKVVAMHKRKLVFEVHMVDERQDDTYLKEHNPLKPVLDRIDMALKGVMHLLGTPLMQEVSKVPVLKPPVTKTNVLKMNRNFKGAMELYDFVRAYEKPGYTVEQREETINPFADNTAEEFAEVVMLTSFLTYQHGLGLKKGLKNAYEQEEERRKLEQEQRHKEQLIQLRKRIEEADCDPMEYMLLLEKRNRSLEQDSIELVAAKTEIESLTAETEELKASIQTLHTAIEQHQAETASLVQSYAEQTTAMQADHEQQLQRQHERFAAQTEEREQRHRAETETLRQEHEHKVTELTETYRREMEERERTIGELDAALTEQRAQHSKQQQEARAAHLQDVNELTARYNADVGRLEIQHAETLAANALLSEQKALAESRLLLLRQEHGLIGDEEDYTAQESFDELERQFKIFKKFFKTEWKKAKKRIRKDILKPDAAETQDGTGDNKQT